MNLTNVLGLKSLRHFICLLSLLLVVNLGWSQSIPFPETYDFDRISPWGHTSQRTNFDTSPLLPFIYQETAMRLVPPNGVSYDAELDTWDFGSGEKYPMLLFFHGNGQTGTSNNTTLTNGGQGHMEAVLDDEFPGFIVYPQNAEIHDMKALIDQFMVEGYPVDPTRIYIMGRSRGAKWTWDFALAYPEVAAAIYPMSGMVDGDLSDLIYTSVKVVQGGTDTNPAPHWTFERLEEFENIGGQSELVYYDDVGHLTWPRAQREDDYFSWYLDQKMDKIDAKYGYYEVCPEDPIDVTLGVNPGLAGYKWRKNGVELLGETNHELIVDSFGDYSVSLLIYGEWTDWSEVKSVKERQPTETPPIALSSMQSTVVPDPNGNMEVALRLPDGFENYEWFKDGISYSNTQEIVTGYGVYTALVQEKFGCSSVLSDPFAIVFNSYVEIPNVPASVNLLVQSETAIEVSWVDNSTNELGFEIWRRNSIEDPYEIVKIVDANFESYQDQGLSAGTEYLYSIRAINENGASELSSELGASTLYDNVIPSAPQNLIVLNTTTTTVTLDWLAANDDVGVEKYYIYQDGVKILSSTDTESTVYNLIQDEAHTYSITAVDFSGNESARSNRVVTAAVRSGLNYSYYEGDWSLLPDFNSLESLEEGVSSNLDISIAYVTDYFGFKWEGLIDIPVAGDYTFETRSDDGSKLYIGGYDESNLVIDNDGLHGANSYVAGTYTFPSAGKYPIVVTFFERTGGNSISLFWKNTAHGVTSRELVPDEAFSDEVAIPNETINEVSGFTATTISYSTIELSWEDTNLGEFGYQLFRSVNGSTYTSIAVLDPDVEIYIDSELSPGTSYDYYIVSLGSYVESGPVYTSATTESLIPPSVPTGFTSSAQSVTSISLSWDSQSVDNYELSRSTTIDGEYTILPTLSGIETSYTDEDLSAHTTYFYRLRSQDIGGFSETSASLSTSTGNTSPILSTSISDYKLDIAETITLTIHGSDEDGDALTFEGIDFPDFVTLSDASINSVVLNITPSTDKIGTYSSLGLKTLDSYGGTSTITHFDLEIYENEAPEIEPLDLYAYTTISSEVHAEIYADSPTVLSYLYSDTEGNPFISSGVINLPSFGNYSQVNSNDGSLIFVPSLSDIGSYPIELYVEDSKGKLGTFNFTLDVVLHDPNVDPVEDYESVQINFTSSSAPQASSPWNNLVGSPTSGHTLTNMSNTEGMTTNISITLDNGWSSVENNGALTGDDSGIYPDAVMNTHYEDNNSTPRELTLTGLDPAKIYDLVFFSSKSSRKTIDTRVTDYQVGSKTVSLITNNNTTETITLKALESAPDGTLTIIMNAGVGSWYYLNALEIRSYVEPTLPYPASSLSASPSSHEAISLNWIDNSSNETSFELYRSTSNAGPWILVSTTAPDLENYVDNNLQENTAYFYRLRSANDLGESDYTEIVSATTFSYSLYDQVQVNFTASSNLTVASPWNNLLGSPFAGLSQENLTNTKGVSTPMGITLTDSWNGASFYGASTGDDTGIYPDDVLKTYFTDNTNTEKEIVITGCYTDKIYELTFLGSYSWGSDRITQFRVGSEQVSLKVEANTTETVTIKQIIPDINGEIHTYVSMGSTYPMYINALEITYYDEPLTPFVPTDLRASTSTFETINLEWTDNSTNEEGFNIYRSKSEEGPWTSITTVGSGIESYQDTGLEDNTIYYYYLESYNSNGSSPASDFAQDTTYLYTYYDAVLINFSNWEQAVSPWNNIVSGSANTRLENMSNTLGLPTSIDIELVNEWSGKDKHGASTGDDSGPYPDVVMSTYLEDDSSTPRELLLEGLDPAKIYDFQFFASRKWVTGRTTEFTVNGKSTTLLVDSNISEVASLVGLLPNSSGELLLEISMPSGEAMKYLNAIEVRYYDEPLIPYPASDLSATPFSSSEIELSWSDKSTNETGFEIYRSLTDGIGWTHITTVGSDVTSYTDTNLDDNTTYYYNIRSYNDEGHSEYASSASAQTYEYFEVESVLINFSNWEVAPSPWNTIVSGATTGLRLENVQNSQGLNTQIDVELLNAWSGQDKHGATTGDDSGPFIDAVMETYIEDNSSDAREILFVDLDPTKIYDLELFSSRKWVTNRTTIYSVNGKQTELIVDTNLTETAHLIGLEPSTTGELLLEVSMSDESPMKYLNGLALSYYEEPEIPFTPSDLTATAYSSSSIDIEWLDRSTNETGYEIQRSTSPTGPWTNVTTVGENVSSYTDTNLEDNTIYYYQVRSINNLGVSNYSPVASTQTYEYFAVESVLINFSNWEVAPSPWNTIVSGATTGLRLENVSNSQGFITQIDVELLNSWSGQDKHGATTGDDSGPFIDAVMETYFQDDSSEDREILFTGLETGKVYDFTFFNSRKWVGDQRETTFTVNGKTVGLVADENISEVALLEGLKADVSGELLLQVNMSAGTVMKYLNGLELSYYDEPDVPFAPADFNAHSLSPTELELVWTDISTNEDGFRVYSSPTGADGTWVLETTLPSDTESYYISGLSQYTVYHYRVGAYNSEGINYTTSSSQSTQIFNVLVNFNEEDAAASPWNNFNAVPDVGISLLNLENTSGESTGIDITLGTGWTSVFPGGYEDTEAGVYPDEVLSTFYYAEVPDVAELIFTGLNFTHSYDIGFLGNWFDPSVTTYKHGEQEVSQDNYQNRDQVTTLYDLRPDSDGEIVIEIYGSPAAILNGLEITVNGGNDPSARLAQDDNSEIVPELLSANLYPNPASYELSVSIEGLNSESDETSLEIFDFQGRRVLYEKSYDMSRTMNLDLGDIQNGVYLVRLVNGGQAITKKLVIRK